MKRKQKGEETDLFNGSFTDEGDALLKDLEKELKKRYEKLPGNNKKLWKLKSFLEFQKVDVSAKRLVNLEHINPLFNRIDNVLNNLSKVIDLKDDNSKDDYTTMNIISLVHTNQEVKRLVPMLLATTIYGKQKDDFAGKKITKTKHLIIDEAHNILNSENKNTEDSWQDCSLSVFEEIIKEGRKFGFYLTLSSQRPSDISATILSQVHNYFIHRLVNDKDLQKLENTMPTLDKSSYQKIPSLGQGEAIVTGNAMLVPVFVQVEKEETNLPNSDDIILTDLWGDTKKP